MSIFGKLFSSDHTSNVKAFEPIVAQINALEPAIKALSDEQLEGKTDEFKKRLKQGVRSKEQGENAKTEEAKILADKIIETDSDGWWFSNKEDDWWVNRNKK